MPGRSEDSREKAAFRENSSTARSISNPVVSLAMLIFLYKLVPLFLVTGSNRSTRCSRAASFNVAEGVIRMAIFLVSLLMSRMKDICRVFEYHGAEHKVVFNFESGQPVNVENAQKFVTFHPRCGTSFLFVMLILMIPFNALIPFDGFAVKLSAVSSLMPFEVGVAYELIRFAAKRRGSFLATTRRPRTLAAAHHHQSRPMTPRRRLPSTRWKAPWPSKSSRAANSSSLNGARRGYSIISMQFAQKLEQLEKRFEELNSQMADPAVIGDAASTAKSPKPAAIWRKSSPSTGSGKRGRQPLASPRHAAGHRPRPARHGRRRGRQA